MQDGTAINSEREGMTRASRETTEASVDAQGGGESATHSAPTRSFEAGSYPYGRKIGRAAYESQKAELQVELLKVQEWVRTTGQKVALLFEGRDAAGKGGRIKRFTEHLNPRSARVVALVLVRSGIRLYKYWFSVTQDEQRRRFASRESEPLKRWKLSPIDRQSLGKWDDYTAAKEAMFFYTDTADAPWAIVKSDDKKRARLNCMRHFLSSLDYPEKDTGVVGEADPLLIGTGADVIGGAKPILGGF